MRMKDFSNQKRLLDLLTEQEEKCKEKLLLHSNYPFCYRVVQNFLQAKLNTLSNPAQFIQKHTFCYKLAKIITRFGDKDRLQIVIL